MMFSIDTNLVLGVVNPLDRLANKSIKLIRKEIKKNKLIIFISVITESKETFLKKYNKSFTKVFEIFQEADNKTDDELERIHIFWGKFNELKQENKDLLNFINLVYIFIKPFVQQWDIQGAFRCLTSYGLAASNTIPEILSKEIGHNIKFFNLEFNKKVSEEVTDIKDMISSHVKFKDLPDKNIFVEIVLYSIHGKEDLKFYSDDKEFMGTSNIVFAKILEESRYSHNKIDFSRI